MKSDDESLQQISMNPGRIKLKALRSGHHDYIRLQTLQQDLQWHICMSTRMDWTWAYCNFLRLHAFQTFSASHTIPFLFTALAPLTSQCFKYFK